MAASVNQDFTTYQGNAVTPVFTVTDSSGVAVNLSTVTNILWSARRSNDTDPVLSLSKTGGAITFVTDGSNGKFRVAISAANTADLSGYYIHEATIVDASANPTTVSVGRMQVGTAPNWTFDPAQVGVVDLYTVRRFVGDVLISDQQLTDQEVLASLRLYSNTYLAAAECCRWIAAQYSRQVDLTQGELQTNYSQRARAYTAKAEELQALGMSRGAGALPYVGGISVTEKGQVVADPDRVTPQFNIGMFENLLPIGVGSGNETPGNPAGGNGDGNEGPVP